MNPDRQDHDQAKSKDNSKDLIVAHSAVPIWTVRLRCGLRLRVAVG